jgi:hypothetical protein
MTNGKGDTPRPVNGDKYRDNYDAIFNKPNDHENKQQATAGDDSAEND